MKLEVSGINAFLPWVMLPISKVDVMWEYKIGDGGNEK